jgi:hypothetical protein
MCSKWTPAPALEPKDFWTGRSSPPDNSRILEMVARVCPRCALTGIRNSRSRNVVFCSPAIRIKVRSAQLCFMQGNAKASPCFFLRWSVKLSQNYVKSRCTTHIPKGLGTRGQKGKAKRCEARCEGRAWAAPKPPATHVGTTRSIQE